MCTHNPCNGSGWLWYWVQDGPDEGDVHEEQEPCSCNPTYNPSEEHSDKECARDVTLAL